MFDWSDMIGNYESRKVARYEKDDLLISTAYVTDGEFSYETAISHPNYNRGQFIIVESYPTKELALERHEHWVKVMTADKLPDKLTDCFNSAVGQLGQALGCNGTFGYED